MADARLKMIIEAQDKASGVLKGLGGSFGAMTAAVALGNAAWSVFSTVANKAARTAFEFGKEAVKVSGQAETFSTSLNVVAKNAGIEKERIDEVIMSLRDSNKSYLDSARIVQDFIIAGIDLNKTLELVNITQDIAAARGNTSRDVLNATREALIQLRPQLLDQFGIQINLNEAYAKYAEELGTTAGKLTIAERRQAFFNAIVEQGALFAGAYEESLGTWEKALNSLKGAKIDLMMVIGRLLDRSFAPFLTGLKEIRNNLLDAFVTADGQLTPALQDLADKITSLVEPALKGIADWLAEIDWDSVIDDSKKFIDKIIDLKDKFDEIVDSKEFKDFIDDLNKSFENVKDAADKFKEKLEDLEDMTQFTDMMKTMRDENEKNLEAFDKLTKAFGFTSDESDNARRSMEILTLAIKIVSGWIRANFWIYQKFIEYLMLLGSWLVKVAKHGYNTGLAFRSFLSTVKGAISEAASFIAQKATEIKESMDKINPFHRESPSLVDNVLAGVQIIKDAYNSLNDDIDLFVFDDLKQEINNVNDSIENLNTEFEDFFEQPKTLIESLQDRWALLNDEIEKTQSNIENLTEDISEATSDFNTEMAEGIVEHQQRLKDLQEEAKTTSGEELKEIRKKIAEEKIILKSVAGYRKNLRSEISEARKKAGMNDLELMAYEHNQEVNALKKRLTKEKSALKQLETWKELTRQHAFNVFKQELTWRVDKLRHYLNIVKGFYKDAYAQISGFAEGALSKFGGALGLQQGFAQGTSFVPETGTYTLHKGEKVVPAGMSVDGGINVNLGGVTITGEGDEDRLVQKIKDSISRDLIYANKGLI